MDRFLQLFGRFVQFSYAAWDRIVLRGYYERLQRPENIVFFFRTVCGQRCITPEVLAARTVGYRRWVENYAKRHAVPLITPPAGTRKEQFVARFYQRYRDQEGVVVILKSMEQSPTFISYEPRDRPASGDDDYRLIKRASKRFLHYYFYVMDPVMGPMSLCVSSYLPFGVNCYMNGHSYLAQHLSCRHSLPQGGERHRQLRRSGATCRDRRRTRCGGPAETGRLLGAALGAELQRSRTRCVPPALPVVDGADGVLAQRDIPPPSPPA